MPSYRTKPSRQRGRARGVPFAYAATLCVALLAGCAGLPPGADFPRVASVALTHPEQTLLGARYADAAREHGGSSGFRILNVGVDAFLTRVQMIDAAQRSLDMQYFIFRGDETGRLITAAVLRAADRGVHVRVLIDDGDTVAGDEQILALDGHPEIEIRIFNPFVYRGHAGLIRGAEFLFNWRRIDYRMHNKLLVVDNAIALIGGRNIGNQYFQMDPDSQFADDDVFSVGPIVEKLSATFDEFWNNRLAIPAAALGSAHSASRLAKHRRHVRGSKPMQALDSPGIDYAAMIATNEPYAGIISGRLPLVWANAQVVYDSPDKKDVVNGVRGGRLMARPLMEAATQVQTELLMITPYFIPTKDEIHLLYVLLQRDVRVAVLTNSLESSNGLLAQAGYAPYRLPLLESGADLFEIRALLGNRRGSGQSGRISSFGNYGLHAKLFVFDRKKLFIGSMNYDQRSKRLNTEIGLIIESPELAQQIAARFDRMTEPANAYELSLRDRGPGHRVGLVWDTVEAGEPVEYTIEPARSHWQRMEFRLLTYAPTGDEL